jgi:hypothetical protein
VNVNKVIIREGTKMYNNAITRSNPSAFLFLVDQSGSMSEKMPSEKSKAQYVAEVLNHSLYELIVRCTRNEGVRDYFHVGVLCYNGLGVFNGFTGQLASNILNPLSEIEQNPLRIEEKTKKVSDGVGSYFEQMIKFPVWFDPTANGGTPMCAALVKAAEVITQWCDEPAHADCFPPTILHITDGESTDGNPEDFANQLMKISTTDGQILMFNLHVSSIATTPIVYPIDENILPDDFSKMLFRMSSPLPEQLVTYAKGKVETVASESRGFVFNADDISIVDFLDIGTRAAQLR